MATPQEAYALVADLARRPDWLGELRCVETPAGPLGLGTRFRGESSLLWHDFAGTSEIVRAEPGQGLAEEVVLGARFLSEWTFTPVPGGTRIRHTVDIDFPDGPLGRIERWVLRRRLSSMQRSSLSRLARLLVTPR